MTYTSSRSRPNQAEIDAEYTSTFGVEVKRVEVEELAKMADILIVLCDQNKQTTGLVNKDFLGRMKKTAILVNAARVSRAPLHGSWLIVGRDLSSTRKTSRKR